MLTHFGRIHLRPEWKESVVCIGTFDGVHRGHQEVIQTAVAKAARHEIPCALVTFDRHPASTLAPDRKPAAIATLEQNLRAFRQMGVGIALVLPFDADMATKTAETFAAEILDDALCARHLVVGHDFALGRGRAGTGEWLAQRYDTQIVPPYLIDGQRVSSSVWVANWATLPPTLPAPATRFCRRTGFTRRGCIWRAAPTGGPPALACARRCRARTAR
jgi:riboflavin kinase/FMN adenylyltransferase